MVEIMSSSLGLYPLPDWTKDELSKLKATKGMDLLVEMKAH